MSCVALQVFRYHRGRRGGPVQNGENEVIVEAFAPLAPLILRILLKSLGDFLEAITDAPESRL